MKEGAIKEQIAQGDEIEPVSQNDCAMTISFAKQTDTNLTSYRLNVLTTSKKIAFTLAEVLITLGIIGVVAAITMPTLIQNHQDKELIVKTKKVWSDINNAFLLSQQEYGVVGDNSLLFNATDSNDTIAKNLSKYFNGAKFCNSTQSDCSQYDYEIKTPDNAHKKLFSSKIILTNGAIIALSSNFSGCETRVYIYYDNYGNPVTDDDGNPVTYKSSGCGNVKFDVNGPKPPNEYGRDVYHFWVIRNKLSPSFDKNLGGDSFKNILSGKDKLEYVK